MQVALSKYEDELSQYIHRAVLLAPCGYLTLGQELDEPDLSQKSMNNVGKLRDIGVYATNGPHWERDLQTICDKLPWNCDRYTAKTGD